MNRIKRTYRLQLLRTAFLIAGLLLFGTQLSYAGASFFRHTQRHPHVIHASRPNTHLALEKRLDFGPDYGLVPPVVVIDRFGPGNGIGVRVPGVATVSHIPPFASPRAPPAVPLPTA